MTDPIAGRFRVVRSLGAGGMGEVLLAEDSKLHRNVALKKLSGPAVAGLESRRRVLHEARLAARLNHPRIAGIYDVVESQDGTAFIVMEYVPGESLARRLEKGVLAPEEAIRIGIQVSEGLAAAHAEGVIHRDLKPANINLTPAGMVKILDFGLARVESTRHVDSEASTTSTRTDESGGVVGTTPYMSPEALKGEIADARGDVYSLGVTLFELLTGRRPFQAENRTALIAAIISQETPRASDIDRRIPEDLSGVVARAMARDPAARYPSVEDLLSELQRLGRHRSKVRRVLAGGAVALLALLAGWWAARHPEALRPSAPVANVVAVLPFHSLNPDTVTTYVAAGITDVVGAKLATLPILVVPPGEANRYRAPDRDLDALARELGASLTIDGSVQMYNGQLRVTLKMSRVGSKVLAWTHICDGDLSSVLRLQEEILSVLPEGLVNVGFLHELPDAAARAQLTRQPTRNEDAFADYNQARAFLEREDLPENVPRAIALFETATHKDPAFAQAFGGLGEACFAQYRKTRDAAWARRAGEAMEKALALGPAETGVRYSRASILVGTGALDEAEKELRRVLHERPNHDAAHSLLGDVYDKKARQRDTIREFQAAIRLRPAYWRHHWRLANVFLDYGRLQEARDEALRVTELQPDNPRGYQLLGTVYQTMGKVEDALASYEASLKLAPTAAAYSNIGGKFFDEKDFQRAETYYRRAVEIDPKLPVYHRNLGDVLLELGRKAEARGTYAAGVALADSVLAVNPNDASTLALQALCLAKLNEGESALARIGEALRLTPSSPNVLYKRTAILALLGRQSEALHALEEALAAGLPASFAASDPDLRSISNSEEFKRLVVPNRKEKP